MAKVSKATAILGILSIISLAGLSADKQIADGSKRTGLKPIDAAQFKTIRDNWPRVKMVHANRLGLERINAHRAKQGKEALKPSLVKPIGQELESTIEGSGVSIQATFPNMELLGELPDSVDNSTQTFFPPIGDQGELNSCLPFATTYYQLSYMSALVREPQVLTVYSPKWTYNMINGGDNVGTQAIDAYNLLEKHGAATLAEFPYDGDYRAWCLTTSAWQNALSTRTYPFQYLYNAGTDAGIEQIKELLTNGYIPVFGTFIMSWQGQIIMDDPATTDDDSEVGKAIGYFVNGEQGSHAMTVVGYNDAVWSDVNGNMVIDPGEKGAFKIVNSWGSSWQDNGFIWLAYDALRSVSAVPDGPSEGRETAFQMDLAFVMTPRVGYSPSMVAEFTVNHGRRSQLAMSLGTSDLASTSPTEIWNPAAIFYQGGAYAFNGTSEAVDGTFVFDATDLLSTTGSTRNYYLRMADSTTGNPATLRTFKIKDLINQTEVGYAGGELVLDNQSESLYVTYTYSGPTANHAPVVTNGYVNPLAGPIGTSFYFFAYYSDADGDAPTVKNVIIDDTAYPMVLTSGVPEAGYYLYEASSLSLGNHAYRFHFEDGRGESANFPVAGTYSGPAVTLLHFVSAPRTPSGETMADLGAPHIYATDGSECSTGDDVQYRFDWGDGTSSDWLPVGQLTATHTWNSPGIRAVKAQARCALEPATISSWSTQFLVTVPSGIPFTESFLSSGFPVGWVQQNIGEGVYNGWVLSPSTFAGGQAYEMNCTFEDVVPGVTRLVTPPISTIGYSQLRLRFKHFLRAWETGGTQLRIQTSTDRMNWTDEAWTATTTAVDIGPETIDTIITHNLNDETTFVAFVIIGDLYYFDNWYIDDVSITRVFSPKVDFNNDSQEDILWRYYGTGGYNRAWFLGNTEGAVRPLTAVGATMEAGPEGPRPSGARVAATSSGNTRKMGIISNPRKTPSPRIPPNVMGNVRRGSSGPFSVDDPRKAGGRIVRSSLGSIADPRDAKIPLDPDTLGDSIGGVTAAATFLGGADVLPVGDLHWQIAGTGDFNKDTHADILWRNISSGANVVWYMNGAEWIGSAELIPVSDLSWQIVGTGDFNNDTFIDILWRNASSGSNVVWYMNGTNWIGSAVLLGVSDPSWQIVGTGDFNKDGSADILWRYDGAGGYNLVWYLNYASWIGSAELIPVGDPTWQIVGTGDYNSDGNIDILWRYNGAGGTNVIWYMNGVAWAESAELLPVPDLTWKIVSR
ncbi:MAG: hypothetical protein C3F08_07645 [Candidatus Methylomirabilota bacterium]|nr:MAG: hypothetical protein C3F08_07645 [candidate division NC10 bacterium]